MLAELKFVQGAVARKDFIPHLTHFKIENRTVRSFNGSLALCSPIDFDIDCIPKAVPFVKAIQNCEDTVSLNMTPAGRLSVSSGSFKAFIECVEEDTGHVEPEGERFELNGMQVLQALKIMAPFIGEDASRPWTNGVLFKGQSAYATNNVSLIEYWIGDLFPIICNVPKVAIREMIRINEPPLYAQATGRSISFHYPNGKWLRTALLDLEWPDLAKVLDVPNAPVPIDPLIFPALTAIKPFADEYGRVYLQGDELTTCTADGEGAGYIVPGLGAEGIYQIEMLTRLEGVATAWDLSLYPAPCHFVGERLRGAIIGMRL